MQLISMSIGLQCSYRNTACLTGHTERLSCSSSLVLGHTKLTHGCLIGIASGKRLQAGAIRGRMGQSPMMWKETMQGRGKDLALALAEDTGREGHAEPCDDGGDAQPHDAL